jgi:hypothetical protein
MLKKVTQIFNIFLSVIILFGIGILIWNVLIFSKNEIISLLGYIEEGYKQGNIPLPLIISVVTALATIITAIVTTLITKSNDLRLQIRTEQRDKKASIYEELTTFFFKLIFEGKEQTISRDTNQEKEVSCSAFKRR